MYAQFYVPLFTTWQYNNNLFTHCSYHTTIRHSSFTVNTNNCSVDLYNGDLQTTIVFFTRNAPLHKINWIFTGRSLLCLAFLWSYTNSLECSCSRFLENSIVISLLFVYFVHIACCCVSLVVYLLFSYWCCCWFIYNKFDVCVSVALQCFHFRNNILILALVILN